MHDLINKWRLLLGFNKRGLDSNNTNKLENMRSNRTSESSVTSVIYKHVVYYLDVKEIYLDSTMSLIKLSGIVGTNTTYLSNTINDCFGCNFKTLLNKYRIEHCKKLLKMGDSSVKDVFKKCGFASSSAFYASFKKITGISPQQYQVLSVYKENEENNVLVRNIIS